MQESTSKRGRCLCGRPATHRVQVVRPGSNNGEARGWVRGCIEHAGRAAATEADRSRDAVIVGEAL